MVKTNHNKNLWKAFVPVNDTILAPQVHGPFRVTDHKRRGACEVAASWLSPCALHGTWCLMEAQYVLTMIELTWRINNISMCLEKYP